MRNSLRKALLTAALLACSIPHARAASLFFGIDQGNGTPPTPPHNSLAARNSFTAALGTIAVDDLESHPVGAPPATLSFAGSTVTATATYRSATIHERLHQQLAHGQHRGPPPPATPPVTSMPRASATITSSSTPPSPASASTPPTPQRAAYAAGLDQLSLIATLADGTTQTFLHQLHLQQFQRQRPLRLGIVSTTSLITPRSKSSTPLPAVDDVHALDDLTIGTAATPVPLPSTLSIGAPALALLALYNLLANRKTATLYSSP